METVPGFKAIQEEVAAWIAKQEDEDTPAVDVQIKLIEATTDSARPRATFTIGKTATPFTLHFPADYPANSLNVKFFVSSPAQTLANWVDTMNVIADRAAVPLSIFLDQAAATYLQTQPVVSVPSLRMSLQMEDVKTEAEGDPETSKRLFSELKALKKLNHQEVGFEVDLIDDNLYHWQANLFKFDPETPLGKDLIAYDELYQTNRVTVDIKFPADYPLVPPFVRVVRPRLQYLTGNVTLGGALCMHLLTTEGWTPDTKVEGLINQIRATLLANGARVDLDGRREYSEEEAKAAIGRLERLRESGEFALGGFQQRYECVPPAFVERWSLEATGSALLPLSCLDELARAGLTPPVIVQIKTNKGLKAYASVVDFVPQNWVVLPYWLMEGLQLVEGEPVRVKAVQLPGATFVRLQPHSAQFREIENPKGFLVDAIQRLAVLSQGDTITMTSQGKKFRFDVLEVKPAPVCAIGASEETPLAVDVAPPVALSEEELQRERLRAEQEKKKKEEAKRKAEEERKQKEKEVEEIAKKALIGEKAVQTETNKCWICSKRIGLTGIKCRCGYTFCSKHRYPDQHNCTFDYKDKNYRPINLVKVAGNKGLLRI